jgi:DNA invertase Pin-like site-specific DNA recombinase
MQRAAIYCRISKDADGEGLGVERQEQDCRKRAEREGWDIAEVFTDNDISASRYARKPRPAYARMLEAARAGEIDLIVAYSNSRLTRRLMELEDLIQLNEQTGVQFRTIVSGDDDLSTADGRQTARIRGSVDAGEAERASERQRRAQQGAREEGIQKTRSTFAWTGDALNPVQAEPLKQAIAAVLEGVSTSEIARRWNAQEVPSVTGAAWTQRRVVEQLVRWRNCGVVVHKGEPIEGIEGKWECICDRQTLDKVRTLLLDPGRRTMTPGRPPTSLMSSVARCGKCGRPMVASKAKSRDGSERFLYRCKGALAVDGQPRCYLGIERRILDRAVLDAARLEIGLGAVDGLTPSSEDAEALNALRTERAQLTSEEGEIGRAMGDRSLSIVAGKAAQAAINARRAELDAAIDAVEGRYQFADLFAQLISPPGKADYDKVAAVGAALGKLHVSQQREVVRRLFHVVVQPGRSVERVQITRRWRMPGTALNPSDRL